MDNNENRPRLLYFDAVKGFTIIMVIVLHSGCKDSFTTMYASYFMPLFFIISGFFIKTNSVKDTIISNVKTLLPAYFFAGIIGLILNFGKAKIIGFSSDYIYGMVQTFIFGPIASQRDAVNVLWFFATLFWGRILYSFLRTYLNDFNVFVVSIVFFIGNYYIFSKGINLSYFHFDKALYCLFFLSVGSLCRKYSVFEVQIPLYIPLIIIFAMSLSRSNIEMSIPYFENLLSDAINASILSILTIYVFKWIEKTGNSFKLNYLVGNLSLIGRHTLLIYSVECTIFIFGFQQLLHKSLGHFEIVDETSLIWTAINVFSRLLSVLLLSWLLAKIIKFCKRLKTN